MPEDRQRASGCASALETVGGIVERFSLHNLRPALAAASALLASQAPLDVVVLGQFKSGKSSLLNAILGSDLLPVGVLPVTAVVTRLSGGPALAARATGLNGTVSDVAPDRIADFVTEAGNPGNVRQIACVDIETPALLDLPGLRLIDTPGLGSVLAHNTRTTREWLPQVAVALMVVGAERPFSEADRRLVADLGPHTPEVVVVLSKVDLLTPPQHVEVRTFLRGALRDASGWEPRIFSFSTRRDRARWLAELRQQLLAPLAAYAGEARARALRHKLDSLATACRELLTIALRAAEQTAGERERLRAAVLGETVREEVLGDELRLAAQRLTGSSRPAFEERLRPHRAEVESRLRRLAGEVRGWRGSLYRQARRFEERLAGELRQELTALSLELAPLAAGILERAEERFGRILAAFRDRLGREMTTALGVTLSEVAWTIGARQPTAPPIAIGRVFDIQIDLLWFLFPMPLFGRLFHRHFLRRIPWEVEKNLARLAGDWSSSVNEAIASLQRQALEWARTELETLGALLASEPGESDALRQALQELDALAVRVPPTHS